MEQIVTNHLAKTFGNNFENERAFRLTTNGINFHTSMDIWFKDINLFVEIKTSKYDTNYVYNRYINQLMMQNTIIRHNPDKNKFIHKLFHYMYDKVGEDFDPSKIYERDLNFSSEELVNFGNQVNLASSIIQECIKSKCYLV